jgi:hypothetical protein
MATVFEIHEQDFHQWAMSSAELIRDGESVEQGVTHFLPQAYWTMRRRCPPSPTGSGHL